MKRHQPQPFSIANPDDQRSFLHSKWETVLLEPNDLIYRIYTARQTTAVESPFWFGRETFQRFFQSGDTEVSREAARALLAVRHDWSSEMNRLSMAVVTAPFLAAYGPTHWQDWSNKVKNVVLIGGAYQLYILPEHKMKIAPRGDIAI